MDNEIRELCSNLVYSIARRYCRNRSDLEDLYQVGNIGLIEALKHYKENKNAKFSTYAHFYIKGEILKYIRENRSIKLNYDTDKLIRDIAKVKEYLMHKNSKEPSIEEIANFLEVPLDNIVSAINQSLDVKSLDYELTEDGENNLYDYEAYVEKDYDLDILALKEELEKLSPFERQLISSRYFEDKSQMETSKELGISQVQVSRKENKILSKIKDNMLSV